MRALENGAMVLDFSGPVPDYRPPIQANLKATFPNGTVMKEGEEKPITPWLFGNWYKSGFAGSEQLLMIGMGVRLGTSGRIEDALNSTSDAVRLRGS
jgi:hypothetical protein